MVDTAKYIGGRLTAPAGGDASDAHGTVDSAKDRAATAADKAGEHSRGALEHGKGMVEQAKEAVGDATHQVSESVKDAKARLTQAAEDAARSAQEAADSVRPHTAEVGACLQLPPARWLLAQLGLYCSNARMPSCQKDSFHNFLRVYWSSAARAGFLSAGNVACRLAQLSMRLCCTYLGLFWPLTFAGSCAGGGPGPGPAAKQHC